MSLSVSLLTLAVHKKLSNIIYHLMFTHLMVYLNCSALYICGCTRGLKECPDETRDLLQQYILTCSEILKSNSAKDAKIK